MTTRDWLWILVRGGGLLLAVFAVLAIPDAFAAWGALRGLPAVSPMDEARFQGVLESIRQSNNAQLIRSLARLIILGALAWYMLFHGRTLINLMHRAPRLDTPSPDSQTPNSE